MGESFVKKPYGYNVAAYRSRLDFKYRHGTHVFVNWLKFDPLFMIFGHFCKNKKEIKNMGDSTSLR